MAMTGHEIECPGCGLVLPASLLGVEADFYASAACRALMYELTYYTLALGDPFFIQQVVVDTHAAQHAGPGVKPISTFFALAGLYLFFERDFTGRQVQRVHMELARGRKEWPRFDRPELGATMTVQDVVLTPDDEKQAAILNWARAVWGVWKEEQGRIASLLNECLGLM